MRNKIDKTNFKNSLPVYIACFVFVLLYIRITLNSPLNLDDIWAYQYANLTNKGLLPYRDFNTFVPPFFILFTRLLLLNSNTANDINIATILLYFISSVGIARLEIRHRFSLLFKFALLIITFFSCNFEYNYLLFSIILFIFSFLKDKEKLTATDVIFLSAISCICTGIKITYGIMITFACLACVIYKKPIKKNIAIFLSLYAGLVIIFYGFLCIAGIQKDFVDQCILPLFAHVSGQADKSSLATIMTWAIVFNITCFFKLFKGYIKQKLSYQVLFSYIMYGASIINVIPTFNSYHFMFVLAHLILFYIAFINHGGLYQSKSMNDIKILTYINMATITAYIILSIADPQNSLDNLGTIQEYSSGRYISFYEADIANKINEYTAGKEEKYMVVSSYTEAIDYFRDDSYKKYLGLLIDGNMGTQNPIDIIKASASEYDYIIFPLSYEDYENLLDWRVKEYFSQITPQHTVDIYEDMSYGIIKADELP